MKKTINKVISSKYTCWILGLYQIFGGIFGYYLVFQQSFSYIISNILIFIFIIGLFTYSIVSGCYLFGRNKLKGLNLSIINQALQLVQIAILGFGFYYVAGFYLGFGFSDTPDLHFIYRDSLFQSSCYITLKASSAEISLVFNIVSLLLLLLLSKMKKHIAQ